MRNKICLLAAVLAVVKAYTVKVIVFESKSSRPGAVLN